MSFAPVWGPESPSHAYIRSSVSAYLASLSALCSSLLAKIFNFLDKLAMRIPPSFCIACQSKRILQILQAWYFKHFTTERKTHAVVFDPGTEVYTLEKLENIDVEKAIYRNYLPSSARSIKVQVHGKKKFLAEVRIDGIGRRMGLKHQRSLLDGFYILPGRAGTQTTITPKDAHEDQLAELPAPGFFNQKNPPVELPTDEIAPVAASPVPRAVFQPASPTPLLLPPKPRSPNSRKISPLLAPPPRAGVSDKRTSYSSSVGSASIQIAYLPSQHEDAGRGESGALEGEYSRFPRRRLLVFVLIAKDRLSTVIPKL